MFEKFLPAVVALLLTCLTVSARAQAPRDLDTDPADEQMRTLVESFGVGLEARVRVTLKNGVKMKGFIDRAGRDHFYLIRTDRKNNAAVVAYRDVALIEGRRGGFNWRNIAYRTGTGAGLVLGFLRGTRLQGPALAPKFPRR